MFSNLKKRLLGNDDGTGYEEVSEKKTTKLGYFLLIVMFFFIVGIGQTVFEDLKDIVSSPVPPSSCAARLKVETMSSFSNARSCYGDSAFYSESYYEYEDPYYYEDSYSNNRKGGSCTCQFTEIDTALGIDIKYHEIEASLTKISDLNVQLNDQNSIISRAERVIEDAERQYELGLQEKMAEEEVLYDRSSQQGIITQQRVIISSAQAEVRMLTSNRDQVVRQVTPQVKYIEGLYEQAYERYLTAKAWYKFKVFGLMLLFAVPFFALSTRWYFKVKQKDSPYTIIASSVMAASAILFLQVVLLFLYDILPKEWLARIFNWLLDIPMLRFVLYYAGVALVIAVFGGLVYLIQKRVFNQRRVAMRRLKKNECPRCSYNIHRDDNFCPACALQLKTQCLNCGHNKSAHLNYCVNCGKGNDPV